MSGIYAQPNSGGLSIPDIPPRCADTNTANAKIDAPSTRTPEKMLAKQVVSKQRVTDHGEVYTAPREVQAMLDLVKPETERIDSRFLEPACGHGNFLAEILARKLRVVEARYAKSQLEYERNAVMAVGSLYGIDKLQDNVKQCRQRLFEIFDKRYTARFRSAAKEDCRISVNFILERNIIHGNALTLQTEDYPPQPIVFSEWSFPFHDSLIKRRDYTFSDLLYEEETGQPSLFLKEDYSDLGHRVFIPKEKRTYPPVHFLKLGKQHE